MKTTHMVYAILIFGITVSITTPHFLQMAYDDNKTYETKNKTQLAQTTENVTESVGAIEKASSVELAVATPVVQEQKQEPKVQVTKVKEVQKETTSSQEITAPVASNIVFDGMTIEQLAQKLDKSLNSTLSGTGNLFAKYAIQYNVDPYLAVAIVLHETGCKWKCSTKVTQCNNIGGMKGGGSGKCNGGSYAYFDTLEAGVNAFMKNLKVNYYDKGLNTPELMNTKYASSTAWAGKINNYINNIKNA